MWYVAGMAPIDRAGANGFNVEDLGNAVFVPSFDLSSAAAQEAYVANCDDMLTWQYLRKTDGVNEVLCPMWDFRAYVQSVLNETFPGAWAQLHGDGSLWVIDLSYFVVRNQTV